MASNQKFLSDDLEYRKNLFNGHLSQTKNMVNRILNHLPDHVVSSIGEDLHMIGLAALWKCCIKFDPSTNVIFWGYAMTRVRGSVLDELRDTDVATRRARAKLKLVARTRADMEQELGRMISDDEVFVRLGFSDQNISKLRQINKISFASLDQVIASEDSDGGQLGEFIADEQCPHPSLRLDKQEDSVSLEDCLDQLDRIERAIVRMYYFNGIQLSTIAKCLGLTESRICQLQGHTLEKLKKLMRKKS